MTGGSEPESPSGGSPHRAFDRERRAAKDRLVWSLRDMHQQLLLIEQSGEGDTEFLSDSLRALVRSLRFGDERAAAKLMGWAVELCDSRSLRTRRLRQADIDLLLELIARAADSLRGIAFTEEAEVSGRVEAALREADSSPTEPSVPERAAEAARGEKIAVGDGADLHHPEALLAPIGDSELLALFREQFEEIAVEIERLLLALEERSDPESIRALQRHLHNIKGSAAQAGLDEIAARVHDLEERVRHSVTDEDVEDQIAGWLSSLDAIVCKVRDEPSAENASKPRGESDSGAEERRERADVDGRSGEVSTKDLRVEDTVRVSVRKLDQLLSVAGEMVVQQGRGEGKLQQLREAVEGFTRILRRQRKLREYLDGQRLRLPQEICDHILMQEREIREALRLVQTRLTRFTTGYEFDVSAVRVLTTRLKDNVMSTRMLPVRSLFARAPRIVRDLAREQGKKVRLECVGAGTELDKRVLEGLQDPLTHLLRNAIDHGIESPDRRRSSGKPETATITLTAEEKGARVHLRIADDGLGIEVGKLRSRAVEQGLVGGDEASLLTEAELIEFLYRPGFSTRTQASEVSGRGVGLDVVRKNIEALEGEIETRTAPGKGTVFVFKLPRTLAIIRGLVVEAIGELFVFPTVSVCSLHTLSRDVIGTMGGRPVLDLDGRILPLESSRDLLEGDGFEAISREDSEEVHVVEVLHDDERLGVVIDRPIGEQVLVVKPLDPVFSSARAISGATTLGNGLLALMLDPAELVRIARRRRPARRTDIEAKDSAAGASLVVLVDREEARRSEGARLLRLAGFRVTSVSPDRAAEALGSANPRPHWQCWVGTGEDLEMFRSMARASGAPRATRGLVIACPGLEDRWRQLSLDVDADALVDISEGWEELIQVLLR